MKTFEDWLWSNYDVSTLERNIKEALETGWRAAVESCFEESAHGKMPAYVYDPSKVSQNVLIKITKAKPGSFVPLTSKEFREVLQITKLPLEIG